MYNQQAAPLIERGFAEKDKLYSLSITPAHPSRRGIFEQQRSILFELPFILRTLRAVKILKNSRRRNPTRNVPLKNLQPTCKKIGDVMEVKLPAAELLSGMVKHSGSKIE